MKTPRILLVVTWLLSVAAGLTVCAAQAGAVFEAEESETTWVSRGSDPVVLNYDESVNVVVSPTGESAGSGVQDVGLWGDAASATRPLATTHDSFGSFVAPNSTPSGNPHGLGVADPPSRVTGPWTDADLARGAMGRPPRSLGSPELHHADQMPGAGIHEIDPVTHRLPGNHPNRWNQGVTDEMRRSDRELHWWYRSQEMGGRDVLGEEYFYD